MRLDGEDATDWAPAERDMAMVFQDHAPYPHLRVRDNLALPLRLAGLPAGEVAERVRAVADRLQLTVHLDRWPSQLSGGQRQRVALGRVLVRPAPAAYLLDEPLSADPALRGRLRAMVAGTTTVWVTPDVAEAAAVGDRVAVLRDGRLAQLGTPQDLAERPASLDVAALAPLNVLPGSIEDGSLRLPIGDAADRPAGPGLGAGRDPAGRPAPGRRRGAAHAAGRRRRRGRAGRERPAAAPGAGPGGRAGPGGLAGAAGPGRPGRPPGRARRPRPGPGAAVRPARPGRRSRAQSVRAPSSRAIVSSSQEWLRSSW